MKKIIIGLIILAVIVLSGCDQIDISKSSEEDVNKLIVCEKPYIRFGSGCCLDQNENKICDKDETTEEQDEIVEEECKEVKIPYEVEETYTEEECTPVLGEADYSTNELICEYVWVTSMAQCEEPPVSMCKEGNSCSDYHHIKYEVTNEADEGGEFTFEIGPVRYLAGQNRNVGVSNTADSGITKYIGPHSSKTFEVEYCMTGADEGCWIEAKSIPEVDTGLEECGDVTKTRTVTKYKTETVCE